MPHLKTARMLNDIHAVIDESDFELRKAEKSTRTIEIRRILESCAVFQETF